METQVEDGVDCSPGVKLFINANTRNASVISPLLEKGALRAFVCRRSTKVDNVQIVKICQIYVIRGTWTRCQTHT